MSSDGQDFQPSDAEVKVPVVHEDKDLERFNSLKIMRSGFEEKKLGNPRLQSVKDMAALVILQGDKATDAERMTLHGCMEQIYTKQALLKFLNNRHPHTVAQRFSKTDLINALIEIHVGLPTS